MAGGRVELALFDVYRDGSRRTEKPQPGSLPRRAGSTVDTPSLRQRRVVHRATVE